jgi:hypothetical protein
VLAVAHQPGSMPSVWTSTEDDMSESDRRSWDEIVHRLQAVAGELRSAAGRPRTTSEEEEAAASRLKADVTRLEDSAAELRAKMASGLDSQRTEFEAAFDRERAEQTAGQFRSAFDELVDLARTVSSELKSATENSYMRSQPELKSAIRALEDVAISAAAWVRAVVDSAEARRSGERGTAEKPRLDDL